MDILALAQEQSVLRKKRDEAHEELQVVLQRVEEAKHTLSTIEARIKGQSQMLHEKQEATQRAQEEYTHVLLDIAHIRQQQDELQEALRQQEEASTAHYAQLEQQKGALEKDIIALQNAKNEEMTELGERKEENKKQGELLQSLLLFIEEEQKKLTEVRAACEQERVSLRQEKTVLQDTSATLKLKEEELYRLRGDLHILRDRYAAFAREHHLPFSA